ncbi:MAG: hypothetical protein AAFV53_42045 [Myxococcota bacterium]
MNNMMFSMLYALCLGMCLGGVQLARASWVAEPPPPPPQPVEEIVAIPPRPEGVREVKPDAEGDGYRYTEQACLKHDPGQLRDICFHQLARQRAPTDLPGALSACEQIPAPERKADRDTRYECTSDVAEKHAPSDRSASLAICPTIPSAKWSDQCVFGIALALSQTDARWAFDLCSQAGRWRDFCRHDVNGEIAQINHPLALEHCAAEQGDLLTRKSCWHGIGKYIARVDVPRAFSVCHTVPMGPDNLYRENCFHGVGWGGAEKASAAFAAQCDQARAQKDSCLLGVAYNLRRADVDAGLQICDTVQRADLKTQCVTFVANNTLHPR